MPGNNVDLASFLFLFFSWSLLHYLLAFSPLCHMCSHQTQIGTPYYLSPEICLNKPYSFKADVRSKERGVGHISLFVPFLSGSLYCFLILSFFLLMFRFGLWAWCCTSSVCSTILSMAPIWVFSSGSDRRECVPVCESDVTKWKPGKTSQIDRIILKAVGSFVFENSLTFPSSLPFGWLCLLPLQKHCEQSLHSHSFFLLSSVASTCGPAITQRSRSATFY